MIRPAAVGPTPETAASNPFQQPPPAGDLLALARAEFDAVVGALGRAGVDVLVADDTPQPAKPDAVFPNNWFSTHPDGTGVLYPMEALNRRLERRLELLDDLAQRGLLRRKRVIDLSPREARGEYLEGTGSLILDHQHGRGYAALSSRTHRAAVAEWSRATGIPVTSFSTDDGNGLPLYHTNVVLSIGQRFAVICAAAIPDATERQAVLAGLAASGRTLIEISLAQLIEFAANILELAAVDGHSVIAMSATARRSLTPPQLRALQAQGELVAIPIPTIETVGGGSVRCMLAELY